MQTNDFPTKYNRIIDEKMNEDISNARQQCSKLTYDVSRQRYSKPKGGSGAGTGASIGMGVGFFVCVGVCIANLEKGFDEASTSGVIVYGVFFVAALILGIIVDACAKAAYDANESRIDNRISSENHSLEDQIAAIQSEAESKKKRYLEWFETTTQKMSANFAESTLAKEVIDWMTSGFFRTIDAADRRAHVERINVPFMFNIYREKITCNLGTYDFELKRCAFLKNPLEQTALARAIATAMQLNTIMHYPHDVNGGEISIQIEYKYSEDHITATITYLAPNGGFKNVTQWV